MSVAEIKFTKDWRKFSGDLLVFVVAEEPKFSDKDKEIEQLFIELKKNEDFSGKEGELAVFYSNTLKQFSGKASRIMLVGLGDVEKEGLNSRELIRQAGGIVGQQAGKMKVADVLVVLPTIKKVKNPDFVEPLLEGVCLADYRFPKYKSEDKDNKPFAGIKNLGFVCQNISNSLKVAAERGKIAALCGKTARDMANEPGNGWTPSHFAEFGRNLAKKSSLSCKVLEKKDMEKLGMGGLLGVSQGSKEAPKMVILEHAPKKAEKTVLMVGKGLTFDSGGVSLKPGAGMQDMKYDMCGGAAVISAMQAVAEEKPNVRVIGIIPATDNMPGGGALKPGDIISHYDGTTSEIINTDAEGRLILADALAYGIEKYSPDFVFDVATLTGAVVIALGHHYTGIFSNDDKLVKITSDAADRAGEPVWRLPLTEQYRKQIKSEVADIKNTGGRPAGSSTAAAYLEKFVGETSWLHFDIAGTAWDFTERTYIPKGPSGICTRTLIEIIRSLDQIN